jgi:hypothetical protein
MLRYKVQQLLEETYILNTGRLTNL